MTTSGRTRANGSRHDRRDHALLAEKPVTQPPSNHANCACTAKPTKVGVLGIGTGTAPVPSGFGTTGTSRPPARSGKTIEMLDTVVIAVGAASALGAFSLRGILQRQAEAAVGADRSHMRFRATLVPLAMIEGGCLFGLTVWMLNGNAVPNLVVAMVLLSVAIAFVPFSDPEAGGR